MLKCEEKKAVHRGPVQVYIKPSFQSQHPHQDKCEKRLAALLITYTGCKCADPSLLDKKCAKILKYVLYTGEGNVNYDIHELTHLNPNHNLCYSMSSLFSRLFL